MKNLIKGLLITAAVLSVPVAASALQLFDFNGQADVPTVVGGTLSMYSIVYDASPIDTPIPLDFANYQFTIVISGLVLDINAIPQVYSGGTLTIYQDNGTAADFANTATFTDGTAILVGNITNLTRIKFTLTLGSVNGSLDWVGGTRLDDIAPWNQAGWAVNSGINSMSTNVLPGFDEQWDGKVEYGEDIVDTEPSTWGGVKALFD